MFVICDVNLGTNNKKMHFEVSFEKTQLSYSEQGVLRVETVRHRTCCIASKAEVAS